MNNNELESLYSSSSVVTLVANSKSVEKISDMNGNELESNCLISAAKLGISDKTGRKRVVKVTLNLKMQGAQSNQRGLEKVKAIGTLPSQELENEETLFGSQ